MQRRQLLTTVGSVARAGLLTGLAGCSGSADEPDSASGNADTPADTGDTDEPTTDSQTDEPEPTPEPTPESTEEAAGPPSYAVEVDYDSPWSAHLSVTGGGESASRSFEGNGQNGIDITGRKADIISANAQKQDDGSGKLTIEILRNGEVVAQSNTTAPYGVASVSKSFF